VAWLAITIAWSEERILDYHSEIKLQDDAMLLVTETIQVVAEGDEIKRGIFRELPMEPGRNRRYLYWVHEATRNGQPISAFTERRDGNLVVYLGSRDVLIPPGTYTYTLTYEAREGVYARDEFDEIYWNVNGTHWSFPIDRVTVRVNLPEAVPQDKLAVNGSTGAYGETGKAFTSAVPMPGVVTYESTRSFRPGENLTIRLGFPKGIVTPVLVPPDQARAVADQQNAARNWEMWQTRWATGLIFAGFLIYMLTGWYYLGKDPAPGRITMRTEPPRGLSPVALRYLINQGYDLQMLSIGLVSLACKGAVTLGDADGDSFVARNRGADLNLLTPDERALYDKLFDHGEDMVVFNAANRKRLARANNYLKRAVVRIIHPRYMGRNALFNTVGVLAALGALFGHVWYRVGSLDMILFISLAPYIFALAGIFITALYMIPAMLRPTPLGRQTLDEAEGFMMALDGGAHIGGGLPQINAVYERYLPFALALDKRREWANRITESLAGLNREDMEYRPTWYKDSGMRQHTYASMPFFLYNDFSNDLRHVVSPPSSSGSGMGGGGFSGGGGGFSGGGGGGGGGGGF
jgi:uncharacterized membrane protein YgcG